MPDPMTDPMTDRGQAGFSLVEMMVAILLLSIAIVGAFRVLDSGVTGATGEETRLLAELVALNRAAELALGETGLPARVDLGGRTWTIETADAATEGGFVETTLRVLPEGGGPGARIVGWRAAP